MIRSLLLTPTLASLAVEPPPRAYEGSPAVFAIKATGVANGDTRRARDP